MTLANKITAGRFGLSLVFFVDLALAGRRPAWDPLLIDSAVVLFLVTVITDVVDGYYARKYGEVTNIGRIADPLVDKIAVCGALILFQGYRPLALLCPAWMVLVVVLREFIVHGLRSVAEAQGIPFGATFWGKQKMFVQCVAVVSSMIAVVHTDLIPWAPTFAIAAMWVMLVSTVVSGLTYVLDARRALG